MGLIMTLEISYAQLWNLVNVWIDRISTLMMENGKDLSFTTICFKWKMTSASLFQFQALIYALGKLCIYSYISAGYIFNFITQTHTYSLPKDLPPLIEDYVHDQLHLLISTLMKDSCQIQMFRGYIEDNSVSILDIGFRLTCVIR